MRVIKKDHRSEIGRAQPKQQKKRDQRLPNKRDDDPGGESRCQQKQEIHRWRCFAQEFAIERRCDRVKMDERP